MDLNVTIKCVVMQFLKCIYTDFDYYTIFTEKSHTSDVVAINKRPSVTDTTDMVGQRIQDVMEVNNLNVHIYVYIFIFFFVPNQKLIK